MKIKTLLQAPLILEELKRLNIDPTTLDPQTRVKLKDGCLVFESEKECFVSAKNEEPEYYYLKYGDVIQEGDEHEYQLNCWCNSGHIGDSFDSKLYLRHRRKTTPIKEPEYYYLSKSRTNDNRDFIQLNDEYCDNSTGFYSKVLEKWVNFQSWTLPQLKFRRKIQKNPTL